MLVKSAQGEAKFLRITVEYQNFKVERENKMLSCFVTKIVCAKNLKKMRCNDKKNSIEPAN